MAPAGLFRMKLTLDMRSFILAWFGWVWWDRSRTEILRQGHAAQQRGCHRRTRSFQAASGWRSFQGVWRGSVADTIRGNRNFMCIEIFRGSKLAGMISRVASTGVRLGRHPGGISFAVADFPVRPRRCSDWDSLRFGGLSGSLALSPTPRGLLRGIGANTNEDIDRTSGLVHPDGHGRDPFRRTGDHSGSSRVAGDRGRAVCRDDRDADPARWGIERCGGVVVAVAGLGIGAARRRGHRARSRAGARFRAWGRGLQARQHLRRSLDSRRDGGGRVLWRAENSRCRRSRSPTGRGSVGAARCSTCRGISRRSRT